MRYILLIVFVISCLSCKNDTSTGNDNKSTTIENNSITDNSNQSIANATINSDTEVLVKISKGEKELLEDTAEKGLPITDNEKKKANEEKSEVSIIETMSKPNQAEYGTIVPQALPTGEELKKIVERNKKAWAEKQKQKGSAVTGTKDNPIKPSGFSHEAFDKLLAQYVDKEGNVDYLGFKTTQKELDNYIDDLGKTRIEKYWSKNQELAFWINFYNAATIKLILDNYPLKSITDLDNGKVWDRKWINHNGSILSLNQIENDIIRPRFKEPRIHFAVNCAAKSCPPLLNKAWTEANVSGYLARQTSVFINNPSFNQLGNKESNVSKIFEWYAEDFGHLPSFINRFSQTEVDLNCKITYADYDWSLNGR